MGIHIPNIPKCDASSSFFEVAQKSNTVRICRCCIMLVDWSGGHAHLRQQKVTLLLLSLMSLMLGAISVWFPPSISLSPVTDFWCHCCCTVSSDMALHHMASRHLVDSTPSFGGKVDSSLLLTTPLDKTLSLLNSQTRSFFYSDYSEEAQITNPRWVHKLPRHPTLGDRLLFPLFSFLAWMRLLCDNFDPRFIAMVVFGQHLLKGFVAGGGGAGLMVVEGLIYMKLNVGARNKTMFQAISSSAWGLKPVYAFMSDASNCGGYKRTPWFFLPRLALCPCPIHAWPAMAGPKFRNQQRLFGLKIEKFQMLHAFEQK